VLGQGVGRGAEKDRELAEHRPVADHLRDERVAEDLDQLGRVGDGLEEAGEVDRRFEDLGLLRGVPELVDAPEEGVEDG